MICKRCNKEITGAFCCVGDDYMHHRCYVIEHPPKVRTSFADVLVSSDDQVLVRELLQRFVPVECKSVIIEKYNEKIQTNHKLMIERLDNEDD